MRNRYPGQCYVCGKWVEAGAGHFERYGNGWRVQHAEHTLAKHGATGKPRPAPPRPPPRLTVPEVTCLECSGEAELTTGRVVYPHRPDLWGKRFWRCPKCGAYVGCHPGTSDPVGQPAGRDTREARRQAHAALDPLWLKAPDGQGRKRARSAVYRRLAARLGIPPEQCHIGMMTREQALRVVALCEGRDEGHSTGERREA